MIEFDVETTGLQWYAGHEPFLAQFWDGTDTPILLDPRDPRQRGVVQEWLDEGGRQGLRAWNSKFDFHMIENLGYRLPDPSSWHDGMLLAHLVDERTSAALKARGAALFGEEARGEEKAVKAWLNQEAARRRKAAKEAGSEFEPPTYEDVPDELMHPYAAEDVVLTRKVCDVYEPKLTDELRGLYELERGVLRALYAAESRGIPVEEGSVRRLQHAAAERCEELHDRAVKLAGIPHFNPNSSDQIAEALKRRGADLTFVSTTATGKPSMDAENLGAVDDELARAIEDFRAEYRILNTYVTPMLQRSWDQRVRTWKQPYIAPDGRIHPNFMQVGARTGRMSCVEPNFQNIPRDDLRIRYAIRADPGMKLVTADLESIELKLLMAFAGDGRLLQATKRGEDMHMLTARMLGIGDRKRAGGHIESARQRAKVMNYLQVYGGGERTVRKNFGVSRKDARRMLDRYADAFPEVGRLQRRIAYRLEDVGYLKTPWGRRHRCYDARKEAYKFVNYLIQGTAADMLKASLVRLHEQGVPIVACVHDELIAHCDEADAPEVARLLEKELIDHPLIASKVPLGAEAQVVDRWSQAKTPDFVPAYERESHAQAA